MSLHLEYKINRTFDNDNCVVLLHGWGMNKNYFNNIFDKLKGSTNIMALDFFGFGDSSNPSNYFDTYEYAYYIFVLLKEHNINNVILVGHSFGGRVALLLSSIFDINVNAQILTSSAGVNIFNLKKILKVYRYKMCKRLVKMRVIKPSVLAKFGSEDYKNCNQILRPVFVKVVGQDLQKHLQKIVAKTFLIWDKKDNVTPYKICKILNGRLVNSSVIIYKTGGHFAFLHNFNKFSELILLLVYGNK